MYIPTSFRLFEKLSVLYVSNTISVVWEYVWFLVCGHTVGEPQLVWLWGIISFNNSPSPAVGFLPTQSGWFPFQMNNRLNRFILCCFLSFYYHSGNSVFKKMSFFKTTAAYVVKLTLSPVWWLHGNGVNRHTNPLNQQLQLLFILFLLFSRDSCMFSS